ncbi:MAG: Aminopeptidase [Labilithrix sp.]|nr:Aminopeptidase [Labilithrix sp.]
MLLAPLSAGAGGGASAHPLLELVEKERGPGFFVAQAFDAAAFPKVPRLRAIGASASALDCVHAKHHIQLDPRSGATVAHLDLKIRAQGHALAAIGLSLDEGLGIGDVTADGRIATVADSVYSPARVVQISLSPALKAGESTVVHVPYEGTLACGTYPEGGGIVCSKGEDFSYFAHQSVIPYVFDPADPHGAELDAMTRDIVLRVPAGTDVIATGEKVDETFEGDEKISTWTIDHPLSRALGMYVFAGKLGMKAVPGRTVPTTFVFPNPELPVDSRLVSWSGGVLDFVEKLGGGPLPFQRSMTLVRLPANVGDPGTATFGMTLLSDSYVRAGDLMHEETWAHENSHLFWGIVVPEASSAEGRMMSEGLATLSELDYTWTRHFASMDRDTYLARRFVPIGLDLRTLGKDLPAVQLGMGETQPEGLRTSLYTLWAYYKTSATLDHLRVTVGDEAFSHGLAAYVKRCSYVGCRPDDFRNVLEGITGKDLAPFFARWVDATSRPEVSIGFEPVQGGADIELSKHDAHPMTLELWLRLDDGQLVKKRVDLAGHTTKVHVATGAWVRSVSASPRHDVLVDAVSTVKGDLDFDGEADGIDLLRCTPLVGKTYRSSSAVGLWNTDEHFDPRCDVNGDLKIDDEDINAIAASFGTFRTAP